MKIRALVIGYVVTLCSVSIAWDERRPSVAMILEVTGSVAVDIRHQLPEEDTWQAKPFELLIAGTKLVPAEKSHCVLVFFSDGHRERSGNTKIVVQENGCEPATAIVRMKGPQQRVIRSITSQVLSNGGGRGAVGILRGPNLEEFPRVLPIKDSRVLSDRPEFNWPAVDGVSNYFITIMAADSGRVHLKVKTEDTKLTWFPGKAPLKRGQKYNWTVTWEENSRMQSLKSSFQVAQEQEASDLTQIITAARRSKDISGIALVAIICELRGAYGEALELFDCLLKSVPGEPTYQRHFDLLLEQAGVPSPGA